MKKLSNNKGFSVIEGLLVLLVIAAIAGVGWYVWDRQQKATNDQQASTEQTVSKDQLTKDEQPGLKAYEIPNEGLTFSYDPNISVLTVEKPDTANKLYVENIKIKTGMVTLHISAGISGIGGGPACSVGDRNSCDVVDRLSSTFLDKPITYRLIDAKQVQNCGYDGAPSCDKAPLTTSFILDTYNKTDAYGPCCGAIQIDARNTGKKATQAGSLLISIEPDKQIQNKELFSNKDFLATKKIIESMEY